MANAAPVADEPATPVEETPTEAPEAEPAEAKEEPKEELTSEQQEEADALLAVNGDVKGELKLNRPLDEEEAPDNADTEDEVATEEEAEPAPAETPPAEAPAPVEVTTEADETGVYATPSALDPGDFKPSDYSFEIKTTDGQNHKIASPEDADALAARLDNNPELISASQFMSLSRKTALMEQGIANDRSKYDELKVKWDTEAEQQKTREQYLNQWQAEVNYLRQKGDLPAITPELNSADWTDPKIADQPGVKETLALYKHMEDENNRRMAAGLPPDLSVVSAATDMKLKAMQTAETEEASREKSTTRARGAMVGKKAPYLPSNTPKGTLVGPARGLNELATEAYYAAQD